MAFLERNANRGSISTGYEIDNSIKVQANSSNEWFYRDNPTAGNKRTFTFSFWMKRTQLDGYQADNYIMSQGTNARFHFAGHTLRFMFDGNSTEMEAAGKLRDTSAWYHIVLAVDTTQSTNTNRVKAYLNGEVYPFNNSDWPSLNQESSWMSGTDMYFNTRDGDGSYDNSGYWSEVAVVDGQQLAPTDFGEYDENSGIWKPKDLSDLTFGSEGFYYKFDNASSLGEDSSGNGNDATLNNIAAANQATDTPTNNFCTLNPLVVYGNALTTGPFEGATRVSGGTWAGTRGTMGVANGKWYYEFKTSGGDSIVGIQTDDGVALTGNGHNILSTCGFYVGTGGEIWIKDSTSGRNDRDVTHTFSSSTINGIAINMDDNQISFYQNGSLVTNGGNIDLDGLSNKTVFPFASNYNNNQQFNFGGYTTISISSAASDANGYGTFEYAPPTGYYALCSKNLAEYG